MPKQASIGRSDAARTEGSGRGWLLAATAWLAVVLLGATFIGGRRLSDYRADIDAEAADRLRSAVYNVDISFRQWSALPVTVARLPQVTGFLRARPGPAQPPADAAEAELARRALLGRPEVPAMAHWLLDLTRDFEVQQAALISAEGVSLVDSGYAAGERDTIGLNVNDRSAVIAALRDGRGYMYTVGSVSGKRGFSFVARVTEAGRTLGALLFKSDPAALERLFADATGALLLLTDDDGIVIAANRPALVLSQLPLLPYPAGAEARLTQQFLRLPPRLDWTPATREFAGSAHPAVEIDGRPHLVRAQAVAGYPYRVWVLAPLDEEPTVIAGVLNVTMLALIVGWALVWLGWRGNERERLVRRTRSELLDMVASLPLTLFRYRVTEDGSTSFVFVGGGAARLFGLSEEALHAAPQRPWQLLGLDPRDPPTAPRTVMAVIDGRERWIAVDGRRSTDGGGASLIDGFWLDVTARHAAERRFDAAFEHAPVAFFFFDFDTGIHRCNPAALRLFGASHAGALEGLLPWRAPLSPPLQADGRSSEAHVRDILGDGDGIETGGSRRFDWTHTRIDGASFTASVALMRVGDEGEGQFFAVVDDISARKASEDALRAASAAAQEATRAKSAFLANMSHEIRTPMNAIIGMTRLALMNDGLGERPRDQIGKAHRAALDLLHLLDDLLDMSKIEAGRLELERVEFAPQKLLDDCIDLIADAAARKGLELLVSAPADLPARLVGDPTRLRQVLVNLASNAIKFTERGSVTLGLSLGEPRDGELLLHGWVRDTGIGLSPAQRERLFEPFVQADSSTTRRFGGSGLGLSICRELVTRMGGGIWAESQPGIGSTFHFHARLGVGGGATLPLDHELRGCRLLLVDDNADAREVLGEMAESLGLAVARAPDGVAALDQAELADACWDWVLIDWQMPGMDGVEVARRLGERLAARFGGRVPRVLLVTAFDRGEALRAAAGLDLAEVLSKPVTPSSLHDCLLRTRRPLPATGGRGADDAAAAGPRWVMPAPPAELAGLRVLLVDDSPVNQEVARELLAHAGVDVSCADSGATALARLDADPHFDCVLMDCQMPGMDGYAATREIRARSALQALPVIAMTAGVLAEDRERALAAGMDDHLGKPLDVARLYAQVLRWGRGGRSAG
ncbi:response regulator [Derxia lacustris]|uniref:response regulator n=1 Tax=Derxia lacustris TaxID=764842 RepID=UPI001593A16B|nr:response regulator [Derxia lacustris]